MHMMRRFRISIAICIAACVFSSCSQSVQKQSVSAQITNVLQTQYPEDQWEIASHLSAKRYLQIFEDPDGNQILFYSLYATELDGDVTDAQFYQLVLAAETVRTGTACQIGNHTGLLCFQRERAYLCWRPSETTVLILEYDPLNVSDADILRMAESAEPTSDK